MVVAMKNTNNNPEAATGNEVGDGDEIVGGSSSTDSCPICGQFGYGACVGHTPDEVAAIDAARAARRRPNS